jgi:hypothetical protein
VDELIESGLRLFGRALYLLVRVLLWGIIELSLYKLPWMLGWLILRTLTGGRYPRCTLEQHDQTNVHESLIPLALGFVSLLALGAWLAHLLA